MINPMSHTLKLIQRIDKLQLEVLGVQMKLHKMQINLVKLPVDALCHIFQYLPVDDLLNMRIVNRDFKLAAQHHLYCKSIHHLIDLQHMLNDANEEYAIIKQSTSADIESNMQFITESSMINKLYPQFNAHKDPLTNLIIKCISILYNPKMQIRHFQSRKFKEWFFTLDQQIDKITNEQVEMVESIIVEHDITYDKARQASPFTFRLLVIIAALLEIQKIHQVVNSHKFQVLELDQERVFYENVAYYTSPFRVDQLKRH
eukprot:NODE_210_length_12844_cov_1.045822.p6 type:complete len:259 gc:universal NODE_210_length_12844_cov_1.045822:4978-4202(-)